MKRRSIWTALLSLCAAGKAKAQIPKGGGACPDENGIGRPCRPGETTLASPIPGKEDHVWCRQCGAEFTDAHGLLRHIDVLGINHGRSDASAQGHEGCDASKPLWLCGNAAPNQCPVCGSVAEPYVRPIVKEPLTVQCPDYDGLGMCFLSPGVPYGPKERTIRCRACNAAFWQDAV